MATLNDVFDLAKTLSETDRARLKNLISDTISKEIIKYLQKLVRKQHYFQTEPFIFTFLKVYIRHAHTSITTEDVCHWKRLILFNF